MNSNSANAGRTRALVHRLRSRAVTDGPGSPFGRLKSSALDLVAAQIIGNNPAADLSDDALEFVLHLISRNNPSHFHTPDETARAHRRGISDVATRKIEVSRPREAFPTMNPTELLDYHHGLGLPSRYVMKDENDD